MSRVIEKNPYYYFMGFPCHILHNNAHVGSIAFNVIMLVQFKGLNKALEDPMIEMRHLFYNSMLPVFMGPNKLFQRKDPCVFFSTISYTNF